MALAKTAASGGATILPEVLAFGSSLADDLHLFHEDVVGSLAHVVMLGRTGIVPSDTAVTLGRALVALAEEHRAGTLVLPDEEDVHMAIETVLFERLGVASKMLHSARSRNDQVATMVTLHVRDRARTLGLLATELATLLLDRAEQEKDVVLPSYTHRQRAQPIALGFLFGAWASMLLRDAQGYLALANSLRSPLGAGAIAGSTLPVDRPLTARLLGFAGPTWNALDTVGDRDFVLDYLYSAAKFGIHASRIATDFVDFSTSEFRFCLLDGAIASGSSMMPQKKNPDVFELIRGKAGPALGNLVSLLTTMKGLPSGYNRDQQEDRTVLIEAGRRAESVLRMLLLAIPKVAFDADRCAAALAEDYTTATDLAEALVKSGIPFREAYGIVGRVVLRMKDAGIPLAKVEASLVADIDPRLTSDVLGACSIDGFADRKQTFGSTGTAPLAAQREDLRQEISKVAGPLAAIPTLDQLLSTLAAELPQ
jgi:argininosuccinate lyase